MKILVTDWGDLSQALGIALKYQVGIELLEYADPENLDRSPSQVEDVKQKIGTIPLVGLHGPFSELVPASRDPLVRQVTRTRFEQGFELAQKIGASHFILHSGFIPKTYPRDIWLQNSFDFWTEYLADKPVINMIHMENVYEDDFSSLLELVDKVNEHFKEERLTICLDIGHVHANSSRSLEDWIRSLGERIGYAHLHNNDGFLDDHWRLDKGKIHLDEVLNLFTKHAPKALWTIETTLSDIEPSLLWLQDRGYL